MKTLDDKLQELSPVRREVVESRAQELIAEELTLREMRKALGLTQEDMAERLAMGQEGVSRLERRGDVKISTLRSYAEALGGSLNVTVSIPGKPELKLSDFSGEQKTA